MKLRELIEKIDQSPESKTRSHVNEENLCRELDVQYFYSSKDFSEYGIVAYYIGPWYCTDTWVGHEVIFLDGEFAALTYQAGRKCDVEYQWVNTEMRERMMVRVHEILAMDREKVEVKPLNLDEEIGDGYYVGYYEQVLRRHGETKRVVMLEDGRRGHIVKEIKTDYKQPPETWYGIVVKLEDGTKVNTTMRSVKVPWWI